MICDTLWKVQTMTGHLSDKLVLVCQSLKIRKQNSQNANIIYRDRNWTGPKLVISNSVHFIINTVFALIHSYLCHKAAKMLEMNRLII